MKQRTTGVEHGTTRHADGTMRAAGDVRMRKGRPPRHQPIKVRRRNRRRSGIRAKRPNGVKTLVIGENKQDVRLDHRVGLALLWRERDTIPASGRLAEIPNRGS